MYYVRILLAQLWEEISRPNRLRQNVMKILHWTPWLRMIQCRSSPLSNKKSAFATYATSLGGKEKGRPLQ